MSHRNATAAAACVLCCTLIFAGGATPLPAQSRDEVAARRLFLEAERLEQEGNSEAALREYQLLAQQFPNLSVAEEALLQVARIRLSGGDAAGTREAIQKLITDYPRSPFAAGAFILEAEINRTAAMNTADLEEIRASYRRIPLLFARESFPRLPWRSEARVRAGEVSLLLGETDQAAATFLAAIEDEPASQWSDRARLGLASVLLAEGDWAAAADVLQRVVDGDEGTDSDGNPQAAARRRLSLIHRLFIRPAAGQPIWTQGRSLAVSGVTLRKPVGVAASDAGEMIIADRSDTGVVVIGASGEIRSRSGQRDAASPWWDAKGSAYVSLGSGIAAVLEKRNFSFVVPRGDKPQTLEKLQTGERGIFGHWFLVDRSFQSLLLFEPERRFVEILSDRERSEPVDLARDAQGRILVLDGKGNRVVRFSGDGAHEGTVLSGQWKKPQALAVDPLGNIYVLDTGTRRVEVFQPNGRRMASVGPNLPGGLELRSPEDLAVDGSGRLMIADSKLSSVIILE